MKCDEKANKIAFSPVVTEKQLYKMKGFNDIIMKFYGEARRHATLYLHKRIQMSHIIRHIHISVLCHHQSTLVKKVDE